MYCVIQGLGPKCRNSYEIGVPPADRKLIMHLHNSLRQLVATGGERRGRPGPQPQGANMREMVRKLQNEIFSLFEQIVIMSEVVPNSFIIKSIRQLLLFHDSQKSGIVDFFI